jgi:hypothetical protein
MGDTMATAGLVAVAPISEQAELSRTGEVLRDIARGGISGVLAGIVVGGLGGRLVMRIAALLHPDAVGALTENGNRIGDITLGGTLTLVRFGIISCAMAGAVWVIVSPWIPGRVVVTPSHLPRAWETVLTHRPLFKVWHEEPPLAGASRRS